MHIFDFFRDIFSVFGAFSHFLGVKFGFRRSCQCKINDKYEVCIRLKWAHKESSINKVCGDYGLPKFWGEYIRKRVRFDNKIKLDPVCSTVRLTYEVKKLCNGWYLAVLSHNIAI